MFLNCQKILVWKHPAQKIQKLVFQKSVKVRRGNNKFPISLSLSLTHTHTHTHTCTNITISQDDSAHDSTLFSEVALRSKGLTKSLIHYNKKSFSSFLLLHILPNTLYSDWLNSQGCQNNQTNFIHQNKVKHLLRRNCHLISFEWIINLEINEESINSVSHEIWELNNNWLHRSNYLH